MSSLIARPSFLVVATLLAGAIMLGACRDHEPPVAAAAQTPRPVKIQAVSYAPQEHRFALAGTIVPRVEAVLGFRVAGKIESRRVDRGATVKAGDVLARLDRLDLDLARANAVAVLAAADADAIDARAEFQRYAELRQSPAFARAVFDKRLAQMNVTAARQEQSRAALRLAESQLAHAVLIADADGVVTEILVEPGQVIASGQAVMRLAHAGARELLVDVPEHRIAALREADRLDATLWAIPGQHWSARLRELSPQADPATRSFAARVTLVEPPAAIALGMSATLHVVQTGTQPVARLPLGALHQQNGGPAVWVANPATGALSLRPIALAALEAESILVAQGVADGEFVVTAGVHKLDAGQRVRAIAAAP